MTNKPKVNNLNLKKVTYLQLKVTKKKLSNKLGNLSNVY